MLNIFDRIVSFLGVLILLPLFLLVGLLIWLEDRHSPIFFQERVGQQGRKFNIMKFRTMAVAPAAEGPQITTSDDDRITKIGRILRKSKLDEIPQLINVIKGDMALVGPRPEVPKYVALYDAKQKRILSIRPGITDLASITFFDEAEMLANTPNPEETYVNEIMPEKIKINLEYLEHRSFATHLSVIWQTVMRLLYRS